MKKIAFYTIIIASMALNPAYAGTITISGPAASPSGNYFNFRLVPQAPLADPCVNGTLYVRNDTNTMQLCKNNSYTPLAAPWDQTGAYVHLVNPNNQVGIGTSAPEFKLTLDNDGGILADGTYQSGATLSPTTGIKTRLIWYPKKAAFRAGKVSGDQWSDANIGDFSTAFGYNNKALAVYSSILGGHTNQILTTHFSGGSVISGGTNNIMYEGGVLATIGGGYNNQIGTSGNNISGGAATIGGGRDNKARGLGSTIAGGMANEVGDPNNFWLDFSSFVGAGRVNKAFAIDSAIAGGNANTIEQTSAGSFIGGGHNNLTRNGTFNTISGGENNLIQAWRSAIGGGTNNLITTNDPVTAPIGNVFIGGGENNKVYGSVSTIGGGQNNITGVLTDPTIGQSTVAGGFDNQATGIASTIGGGAGNRSTNQASTVAGGNANQANGANSSVLGGFQNIAGGNNSIVLGGYGNQANGDTSLAVGANMVVTGARTMAFGYNNAATTIAQNDAIILLPFGNVGVGTTTPQQKLHVAGAVQLTPQVSPPPCLDPNIGTFYVSKDGALCYCGPGPTIEIVAGAGKGTCP